MIKLFNQSIGRLRLTKTKNLIQASLIVGMLVTLLSSSGKALGQAAVPSSDPFTILLKGIYEPVVHGPNLGLSQVDLSDGSGFTVLKVKAKGHRDQVTVVGSLPSANAGEWVTAEGRWVQDREFGLQFRAEMLSSTAPTTREGIEKYLGSGMVKGIACHLDRIPRKRFHIDFRRRSGSASTSRQENARIS
jgi:hypothetical protein